VDAVRVDPNKVETFSDPTFNEDTLIVDAVSVDPNKVETFSEPTFNEDT